MCDINEDELLAALNALQIVRKQRIEKLQNYDRDAWFQVLVREIIFTENYSR